MSIDIEQRGGITHHNDTPNPALPNDEMIYEVKDFMSYFLEMDVSILLIQHTYAYLKHHNNFNNGRDVSHYDVGWWIKRNCPNELNDISIPDEVVKKGIYSDEKLRVSVGELFSNLWEHNITTTLRDAYLAVSAVGVEGYACEDLIRTAIEHGDCMRTAWLILNNKTLPLDPNSQDVIDLCNNMHKHGVSLSVPMNANPLVWGNRRLPQLANLICDDDDEMTNNIDDEVLSSIFNKMKELSLQGLDRLANSVQPEIEKCVRLATEAEKEKDERERLAAEEEEKECERLAAEAKKVEEEARIALAAVEAKAKEERDRLAAEAKENECERLAVGAKERERLVVETTTDNDDPEFGDQDPFGDMEDNATLGGENSAKDDAISISSVEDDGELDEAEQEVEIDDNFESQLPQRFASAFNKLDTTLTLDFKPDDITHEIAEEYQKNCKARGGCSFKENGNRISKLCTDIRHTGKLRKKKLVIGAGRTSPNSQRVASAGKQQAGCFIEEQFFDKENTEVYPHLLFGFGDDRKRPHKCLAFMELIKVVLSCDCDEIEVWFKSTLRVALEDEDFLYYVGTLVSLDPKKKVTIRCMENGLLTYEMLKEISQAKKVREDKLKAINQVISHINASKNLSIVPDENYEWNVKHHQSVESKAKQYKSEWGEHGLPVDVIKDLEIVEVGEGSKATAKKWRESLNEANEELRKLKPSQHEYITASEDKGGTIVSDKARELFVEPTTCERRGKDKRPIAYFRTSKQDDKELNSTDFIECDGEYLPIDQLAWVYADIKLRGYTGKILIIVDNGVQKSNECNKGMSLALDSVQDSDFGAVFMTTPNRAFEDPVAFQIMLEAETIYPGFQFYCSQDTGKNRLEGARKVGERKIRRQAVTDEYNEKVAGIDARFVSTLSVSHLQLNNRMKRAASWRITRNRLETVSSIQISLYGSPSPWIPKAVQLMNKRKRGDQPNDVQISMKRQKTDASNHSTTIQKQAYTIHISCTSRRAEEEQVEQLKVKKRLELEEERRRAAAQNERLELEKQAAEKRRLQLEQAVKQGTLVLITSNNTTGYKGVTEIPQKDRDTGTFTVVYKATYKCHLGQFDSKKEAAMEYALAHFNATN